MRAPVLYITRCSDRFISSQRDVCFSRSKLQSGEGLCRLGVYRKQQTDEGCGVGEESWHSCMSQSGIKVLENKLHYPDCR